MTPAICLENISIVLNRPRYPENIGAAARAICNMGMSDLVVVSPENYNLERVRTLATHAARPVVDQIRLFTDLRDAVSPFGFVVGTTARQGGQRDSLMTPESLAARLVPISQTNRVAIVFGPEDRGLTNEDLRLCHCLLNIPTADFSSLNLAQAVMVVSYALFTAAQRPASDHTPRLAERHELDGMYDQLREVLVRINYINPENPDYWMHKLRQFFTRLELRAKEVSIIRGIIRQVNWYGKKQYDDGIVAGRSGNAGTGEWDADERR
ncbi:MAG: RNA methyltransferase [Pseudomonadota bacterium]